MIPLLAAAGVTTVAKVAEAFAANTLGQLFQLMFESVDATGGAFGGGVGEATWRPMLTDAIAQKAAAHGGLGLAQPVMQQLLQAQEKAAG
jgi:flagellar protein FlgJ